MDYYGSLQAALTAFIQCELASQAGAVSESRSVGEASQFAYPLPAKSQSSNPIQSVSWEPLRERTEDEGNVVVVNSRRLRSRDGGRVQ
jgi:hypothetical protein